MNLRRLRKIHRGFGTLHARFGMGKDIGQYGVRKNSARVTETRKMINDIEDVIHEFAHVVAQGVRVTQLRKYDRLPILSTNSKFGKVSALVSDCLEIDTNAITLLAGEEFGLWGADRLSKATQVISLNLEGFQGDAKEAILTQMCDRHVRKKARSLVQWLVKQSTHGA